MTRPPFRTSSSRYIRAIQSRHHSLNLSRLPKLPEGTPPLIVRLSLFRPFVANQPWQSRRSIPGDFGFEWSWKEKAVDDDFSRAVRLESSAEKKVERKSGRKLSQKAMRFSSVQMPSLDIRMIPSKMLMAKEQGESPILSKNPRKEVLA